MLTLQLGDLPSQLPCLFVVFFFEMLVLFHQLLHLTVQLYILPIFFFQFLRNASAGRAPSTDSLQSLFFFHLRQSFLQCQIGLFQPPMLDLQIERTSHCLFNAIIISISVFFLEHFALCMAERLFILRWLVRSNVLRRELHSGSIHNRKDVHLLVGDTRTHLLIFV